MIEAREIPEHEDLEKPILIATSVEFSTTVELQLSSFLTEVEFKEPKKKVDNTPKHEHFERPTKGGLF